MNKKYNVYNVSRAAIFRLRRAILRNLKIAALFVLSVFAVVRWNAVWSQTLSIAEIKRRITPAHEILLEYERLKFDMTPAGIKAAEERAAEESRLVAERAEQQRREAEERRIAEERRRESVARETAEKVERERREAEEKRRAKREEIEKGAVRMGEEFSKARGFSEGYGHDFDRYGMIHPPLRSAVHYGTKFLQEEYKQAVDRVKKASPLVDTEPLQQAIVEIKAKIMEEREKIARQTFFLVCNAQGSNLTADHRNDQASFTMTIDVGVTIADRERTLIENIELFPRMRLTAVNRDSNNKQYILLHISGSVANVAEYWENWKDYEVIVYFDNMRTTDKIDASFMGTNSGNKLHGDLRINVLAIDIIKR